MRELARQNRRLLPIPYKYRLIICFNIGETEHLIVSFQFSSSWRRKFRKYVRAILRELTHLRSSRRRQKLTFSLTATLLVCSLTKSIYTYQNYQTRLKVDTVIERRLLKDLARLRQSNLRPTLSFVFKYKQSSPQRTNQLASATILKSRPEISYSIEKKYEQISGNMLLLYYS